MIRLHIGDVRAVLAEMEPGSVDLVATSWPFLALRSYLPADHPDKALEIGQEATPADYLDTLLDVTEGFGRVLAPHGSICTELGDTMAGSGGAGGDYDRNGFRDGQARWVGSAAWSRSDSTAQRHASGHGNGWPLDKSMCVLPHLYAASLAYGRNLLNPERVTDPWRVRNIVAWVRNNPPVGSLGGGTPEEGTGDARFRAATSYLTIACKGRSRWFDLDAVRKPMADSTAQRGVGNVRGLTGKTAESPTGSHGPDFAVATGAHPAGAPPLDWWLVNPRGYSGAHFAVWPTELLTRPIQAMCPRRVCRTCGVPSRRITFSEYRHESGRAVEAKSWPSGLSAGGGAHSLKTDPGHITAENTTLGWTCCGCVDTGEDAMWAPGWRVALRALRTAQKAERATKDDGSKAAAKDDQRRHADALGAMWLGRADGFHSGDGWRPGVVLDPFAGSGTTLLAASGLSRDAVGIDIDERSAGLLADRLGPLVASGVEIIERAPMEVPA